MSAFVIERPKAAIQLSRTRGHSSPNIALLEPAMPGVVFSSKAPTLR